MVILLEELKRNHVDQQPCQLKVIILCHGHSKQKRHLKSDNRYEESCSDDYRVTASMMTIE